MRLARLSQMSLGELALRSRQEASKWLERVGPAARPAHRRDEITAPLAGFLGGAREPRMPALIAERFPQEREAVLASAGRILEKRFDLLGYHGLSFGDPLDWHFEPVAGRRLPRVHWSRIDPLDAAQVGDSKVVWELGRMQWLVTLGQAYRLTGAAEYAAAAASAVRGFLDANPPGVGIHWASSLECALRIVSWAWSLALFGEWALGRELAGEMAASLEAHARHVERYLSFAFSPNTHLTGEALGLVYAALLRPGRSRARRWRARGLDILASQARRQILDDGIYFEQAAAYQRYTAEIGLHLLVLAKWTGLRVPEAFRDRLRRLLDALLWLRRPDGGLPAIGDADGGWLLPLVPRAPDDLRGVFGVAAVLFARPDYAWAAGGAVPEVPWLLGEAGLRAFDALAPSPPAEPASRLFAQGGYVVMSSGWQRDAHQLVFDVGPLGCPVSGGHGHADLLSIQCSAFGEPYVVDAGTYAYTAPAGWRDFFRGSRAHATLMVDGASQAEPQGPFRWKERPQARLGVWMSAGGLAYADARHDAYARPPDEVVHRRRILFVKTLGWLVLDELQGGGAHSLELRFPFTPRPLEIDASSWVRARGSGGRGLLLRVFADLPLAVRVRQGETDPIEGWISPAYGQRVPAPTVVYAGRGRLPLRLLTLLLPVEDASAPPPRVGARAGADGRGPLGLDFEGGSVSFASDCIAVRRPARTGEEVS
jgi:hypothetical protein